MPAYIIVSSMLTRAGIKSTQHQWTALRTLGISASRRRATDDREKCFPNGDPSLIHQPVGVRDALSIVPFTFRNQRVQCLENLLAESRLRDFSDRHQLQLLLALEAPEQYRVF